MSLLAMLSACGVAPERDGAPSGNVDLSDVPDAVPRMEPKSRYGNPPAYVVNGREYHTLLSSRGYQSRGIASWYGTKFHGRRTSSGETYNMYAMTAAHTTLPLPSYVEVTNLENRRRVVVRVNDRGPFHPNRIIDLSYAGAYKLRMLATGTAFVEVRAIDPSQTSFVSTGSVASAPLHPGARLYLQAGAFASRQNAERLRLRLDQVADAEVAISEAFVEGRTLYRVRLGPLIDVEHADRLAFLLADAGVEESHLVLE